MLVVCQKDPKRAPKTSAREFGVHGVSEIVLFQPTELVVHSEPAVLHHLHLVVHFLVGGVPFASLKRN